MLAGTVPGIVALLAFIALHSPTEAQMKFLGHQEACDISMQDQFQSIADMKQHSSTICDPGKLFRCIERGGNATCLCDPLLAKQMHHTCVGLYGAPCSWMRDHTDTIKIEAECYGEGLLDCGYQKSHTRKLSQDTEEGLKMVMFNDTQFCKCKNNKYPLADGTCPGGAGGGAPSVSGGGSKPGILIQPPRQRVRWKDFWFEACNIFFYVLVIMLLVARQ